MFMRTVKSRSFFEQMKGRGVRVISDDDLQAVTSDAKTKDRFVIVDAVGVCEQDKTDSRPMDRKKYVSFEKLLQAVSLGNTETEVISSITVRLSRLNRRLSEYDHARVIETTKGKSLKALAADLVSSLDPDRHLEKAKSLHPETDSPTYQQIKTAAGQLIQEAVKPLYDPNLRGLLLELQKKTDQTIDHISQDQVIEAEFDANALEKAKGIINSFKDFIEENKDEITALQILYNRPYKAQLSAGELQSLADAIRRPPHHLTEDKLWKAYAMRHWKKIKFAVPAPNIS
jgi:type I restriction enzyme R subunit